ncbi:Exocyst 84 [Carabus blaptoides fortunei]
MCRTCLNEDGMMHSVFSKENQIQRNQSYADMLMACASVQVNADDGLPKFICEQCMKQLIVAFYFKEQSEQSYATLRELTKNPSIEFIKEEAPEAYTDITSVIQVDLKCTNVQQQYVRQVSSANGEVKDETNSEEFKLSKEFLSDDIVLDYDMVNDIDAECTETITGDIGDNNDELFRVKPQQIKPNYSQFKRIKLPGRTTNTGGNKRGDAAHVCPYCEHKFKDKQEFRRHKRTHILSYRCELCDKQFRSAHGLNYHTKIHQGIKNFVCPFEECSRRFTLKQALNKHLSVHTQEKNHLCSLCGKAYGTYDALHYHIRTHKGERPYLCMHCELTLAQLSDRDFNPEKYVKELSQQCVGGQELQRRRKQIQYQAEKTSGTLKKNVYENYMQFIDTAKEISHLESEMYQLSHLLSEQRVLLSNLAETALLADETPAVEVDGGSEQPDMSEEQDRENKRRKLTAILEKVEGCTSLLDVPQRTLVYHDDLVELDPVDNTRIQNVHGYLLSDSFMLAPWLPDRHGPVRYKFQVLYELGSLAVVNVRDLGPIKHAFKILAFPDTRVFQCSSSTSKKDWLQYFDATKKARLTQDTLKRETATERSPSRAVSVDSPSYTNPFEEQSSDEELLIQHPEWFVEVAEDLDVYVAQRHFEDALALLTRAQDYMQQREAGDSVLQDIRCKVAVRHCVLTETLMRELAVGPDKSLRAARRAVRLLNQLGRSAQACQLFLQLCSSILKTQCKRVKRDGSTGVYVKHLSTVVFTNMCHMAEEFLRAFPESPSCAAAFVVWAGGELNILTSHLIKQVFMPQSSLSTLTDCVVLVRIQCERLCEYGIDLCYQLDGALRSPLSRTLRDTRDKLTDAVKLRAADDKWRPTNLGSRQKMTRLLQEYQELGIRLDEYVTGDCWLQLTANTLAFIKLYLSVTEDCLRLHTPELLSTVDETLYEVFKAQLRHVQTSVSSENTLASQQTEVRQLMIRNGMFLLGTLLPFVEDKYSTAIGFPCASLNKLHSEYAALEQGQAPAARSVTKYSTTEYI